MHKNKTNSMASLLNDPTFVVVDEWRCEVQFHSNSKTQNSEWRVMNDVLYIFTDLAKEETTSNLIKFICFSKDYVFKISSPVICTLKQCSRERW